jgi:hypothetical protein
MITNGHDGLNSYDHVNAAANNSDGLLASLFHDSAASDSVLIDTNSSLNSGPLKRVTESEANDINELKAGQS